MDSLKHTALIKPKTPILTNLGEIPCGEGMKLLVSGYDSHLGDFKNGFPIREYTFFLAFPSEAERAAFLARHPGDPDSFQPDGSICIGTVRGVGEIIEHDVSGITDSLSQLGIQVSAEAISEMINSDPVPPKLREPESALQR